MQCVYPTVGIPLLTLGIYRTHCQEIEYSTTPLMSSLTKVHTLQLETAKEAFGFLNGYQCIQREKLSLIQYDNM